MPFTQDQAVVDEVGDEYGKYMATFVSENGQAEAQIFEEDNVLVAHVSFAPGFTGSNVTDRYYTVLKEFARENGFGERIRLVFAE